MQFICCLFITRW